MTDLARLREPFPPEQIGKLPRVWCKACRDAGAKHCSEHPKIKCEECRNNITKAHLHLDYVGHAEVTHRLLDADPAWSWEPLAFDDQGLPALRREGKSVSLWIKLTVAGITRLGVGIVDAGKDELDKQLISDALRNAAMRFGVALDLWAKSELDHTTSGDGAPQGAAESEPSPVPPSEDADIVDPSAVSTTPTASTEPPVGRAATPTAPLPTGDQSRGGDVLGEVDATPASDLIERATLLITSLKGKSTKEWLAYRRNQNLPLSVKEYGEKQLADAADFLEGLHAEQVPV